MLNQNTGKPYKVHAKRMSYNGDYNPDRDGPREPDETVVVEMWFEGNGDPVVDPLRIAELEESIA